ncbi:unnamed protein product [Urochloa humidicola]
MARGWPGGRPSATALGDATVNRASPGSLISSAFGAGARPSPSPPHGEGARGLDGPTLSASSSSLGFSDVAVVTLLGAAATASSTLPLTRPDRGGARCRLVEKRSGPGERRCGHSGPLVR